MKELMRVNTRIMTIEEAAALAAMRAVRRMKVNPQTKKNKQRLQDYRKRMAKWVVAKGVTHRAVELYYFNSTTYTDLKKRIQNEN